MKGKTNCDCCANYVYDEEYNCYECHIKLDQDEMEKFMSKSWRDCPYFQFNDEYKTARKQI